MRRHLGAILLGVLALGWALGLRAAVRWRETGGASVLSRMLRVQNREVDALVAAFAQSKAASYDVDGLVNDARARYRAADWPGAVTDLRQALSARPDHRDARVLLGHVLDRFESDAEQALAQGDFREAVEIYDDGIRLVPESGVFRAARRAVALRVGLGTEEKSAP